jgi:hypothetical protein
MGETKKSFLVGKILWSKTIVSGEPLFIVVTILIKLLFI